MGEKTREKARHRWEKNRRVRRGGELEGEGGRCSRHAPHASLKPFPRHKQEHDNHRHSQTWLEVYVTYTNDDKDEQRMTERREGEEERSIRGGENLL